MGQVTPQSHLTSKTYGGVYTQPLYIKVKEKYVYKSKREVQKRKKVKHLTVTRGMGDLALERF